MGKTLSSTEEIDKAKKFPKIAILSSWGKRNLRSSVPIQSLQDKKPNRRKVSTQIKPKLTQHHFKKLDYLVKPVFHFSATVGLHFNVDPIKIIKQNLSVKQLEMFKNTCFGHFLEMESIAFQPQLIHSLLLREVHHENPKELWFRVNGNLLKFGMDEFALITGLKCIGNYNKLNFVGDENTLLVKYFNCGQKIDKSTLIDCFYERRWDTDEDAVKLTMLMFVHVFLLQSRMDKPVKKVDVALINGRLYNDYPWGKEVFDVTVKALKSRFYNRQCKFVNGKSKKSFRYTLSGFPLALQIWFYECCTYVDGRYAFKKHSKVPRILNWTANEQCNKNNLYTNIFDVTNNQVKLKNLSPTSKERQHLFLYGLFEKGKRKLCDENMFGNVSESSTQEITQVLHFLKCFLENNFEKVYEILRVLTKRMGFNEEQGFDNEDASLKVFEYATNKEPMKSQAALLNDVHKYAPPCALGPNIIIDGESIPSFACYHKNSMHLRVV